MSKNIIRLNEASIKGELKNLGQNSVEETINTLLEYASDDLVDAEHYERPGG